MSVAKRAFWVTLAASLSLFIVSVVGLGLRGQQASAAALPPTSLPRDCPGNGYRISGRCFNEGYITGSQDYDSLVLSFPMPLVHQYDGSCNGIPSVVDYWSFPDVACSSTRNAAYTNTFISLMGGYLNNYANAPDPYTALANYGAEVGYYPPTYTPDGLKRRQGLAAAMYVHTMMGTNGYSEWGATEWADCPAGSGNWWGVCYAPKMDAAVASAKTKFAEWAELVRQYDQQGFVNWNANEMYNAGAPNSGGINAGTDIAWHPMTLSGYKRNTIVFYSPTTGARLYGINRDCGNLVGDVEPLEDIDNSFNLTPVPQKPTFDDDELPGNATFSGSRVSYDGPGNTINGITVSKRYYIDWIDGRPDTEISTGSGPFSIPNTGLDLDAETIGVGGRGLTAGDQVCLTITVNPATGNVTSDGSVVVVTTVPPPDLSASATACERVVNRPYVSFYGSDVKAGGGVEGIDANCDQTAVIKTLRRGTDGSNVQIAAFALGAINGMTSASYASGATPSKDLLTSQNFVTYDGCMHNFYDDREASKPWTGTIPTLAADIDREGKYNAIGPVSIGGITVGNGQRAYIYVDGDVTINDNIAMADGPWKSREEMPSFYVIASGNIHILPNVRQIEGVYIAQGTGKFIATCSNGTVAYSTNDLFGSCSNQLVIDGAFITRRVDLGRSHGSLRNSPGDHPYTGAAKTCANAGTVAVGSTCASEVFRYSPSIYLAPAPRARESGGSFFNGYETITNLPPVL